MSESAMDGEGSNLPNNHDSYKENCSLLSNGQTLPSPNDQSSNDGTCKVNSPISEYIKDASECSACSLSPSKETSAEESKKSKFGCQSASSQIHNKNTEEDH